MCDAEGRPEESKHLCQEQSLLAREDASSMKSEVEELRDRVGCRRVTEGSEPGECTKSTLRTKRILADFLHFQRMGRETMPFSQKTAKQNPFLSRQREESERNLEVTSSNS